MICRACGTEVSENSVYCHKCGERVDMSDQLGGEGQGAGAAGNGPKPEPARGELAPQVSDAPQDLLRRRDRSDDVEEQLWEGCYSSKDMISLWAIEAIITLALLVAGFYFWQPILWLVILAIAVLMWSYTLSVYFYRRLGVRYRLTSQRFFHERGILRHVTDRIEVIDMDDIATEQSLLQRFVNVGRLRITSSDRTHPELILEGIENVHRVAQMMDDARRAERLRRGLHIESI